MEGGLRPVFNPGPPEAVLVGVTIFKENQQRRGREGKAVFNASSPGELRGNLDTEGSAVGSNWRHSHDGMPDAHGDAGTVSGPNKAIRISVQFPQPPVAPMRLCECRIAVS